MQKERASKKQQELLSFVDGFIKGNGYGPSYREIMRALGYKSVSTVAIHIDNLIAKGYLSRKDNSARSLEVVTLRTSELAKAAERDGKPELESELLVYVKNKELTADQSLAVKKAMDALGFSKVAAALEQKEDAADVESN